MASSVAAACSSKLNVRQNFLRRARPSARLMRPPCGRVHDELHPARLVEEPLEHELRLASASHRARRGRRRGSRRSSPPRPRRSPPPRRRTAARRRGRRPRAARRRRDAAPTPRSTARRCAPAPRRARTGSWAARRRRHAPARSRLDLADLPRVRAEQEHVARHRLDGQVLVDGADERVVGLGHHAVVAGLGDGATRGERGDARPCARGPRRSPRRGARTRRAGRGRSGCRRRRA